MDHAKTAEYMLKISTDFESENERMAIERARVHALLALAEINSSSRVETDDTDDKKNPIYQHEFVFAFLAEQSDQYPASSTEWHTINSVRMAWMKLVNR